MLKITYNTSNLFTLKKYNFSNLNAMSYPYPTIYGVRCAILNSIIKLEGKQYAQDIFHKIKNAVIYIQYPDIFKTTGERIKRLSNSSYNISDEDALNMSKVSGMYTMGYREFVDISKIQFYIDKSIPNIELYLKNIDWLGSAESMVYLDKIEDTNELNNIMLCWNENENTKTYEQYDWDKKVKFENLDMYNNKYKHLDKKIICCVRDIVLSSEI